MAGRSNSSLGNGNTKVVGNEWLGSCSDMLSASGIDSSLRFLCRHEYTLRCNWKVFCDNYLDGGYHVPYAHKGLASGLNLESYTTTMFEKVSLQTCDGGSVKQGDDFDRLGSKATYAFIFPNFMDDKNFIEKSLEESKRVQMEDIVLCEGVQKGLESAAYRSGRYAPTVEKAMHHFHSLLHENLVT